MNTITLNTDITGNEKTDNSANSATKINFKANDKYNTYHF